MTLTTSPLLAVDAHDERRLSLVHPPEWVDPVAKDKYDLVVLGAGTGGLVCAAGAAGLGARVALVEENLMGGDCLNVGCVPSKALIAAARSWHTVRSAEAFGGPAAAGDGDFEAAMTRMRRLRADLSPIDSAGRFTQLGVDVFLGRGRFTAPDQLEVNGQRLRFRRAVVATGARPTAPPIPGLADVEYLTNETVFSLTSLPQWLVVLGAGPIGCELAQAFARLGSTVTLLDQAPRVLPREDPDAAAVLARALVADGVRLELGVAIERIERVEESDGFVRVGGGRGNDRIEIVGDTLLVATGRAPNVDGLGLESAGVAFERSGITVNDRLRTTNRRIFAVGDVCSPHQFTHAADFQARLVLANALFFGRGRESRLVYPRCTYTSPEVAHVGLTPEEAAERGLEVQTITIPFRDVDRAVLEGEEEGFLRVHLKKGSDRILGVTIVDGAAGELISEAAAAITNSLGLSKLGRTIHPYPTRAEAYRKAADVWRRGRLTPGVRRLMDWWFRIFR
jgi:pyruvate/2-oxoglutarate dehydrogenase complex dihydrolipoamide dehydrogenase (E3) component